MTVEIGVIYARKHFNRHRLALRQRRDPRRQSDWFASAWDIVARYHRLKGTRF